HAPDEGPHAVVELTEHLVLVEAPSARRRAMTQLQRVLTYRAGHVGLLGRGGTAGASGSAPSDASRYLSTWRHRSWIFPRDPDFAGKAGRVLDLYARIW